MSTCLAAVALAGLLGGSGVSDDGWEHFETFSVLVSMNAAADGATLYTRPDGEGLPLTHAYAHDGSPVDATITATFVDPDWEPIVGIAREDLWLASSSGGLAACADGTLADGPTDELGNAYWRLPLRAGGHTVGESLRVVAAGMMLQRELDLTVKSPDLDGDLVVLLPDIAAFIPAIGTATNECDFNNDGVVDLADIARFVAAIGVGCR